MQTENLREQLIFAASEGVLDALNTGNTYAHLSGSTSLRMQHPERFPRLSTDIDIAGSFQVEGKTHKPAERKDGNIQTSEMSINLRSIKGRIRSHIDQALISNVKELMRVEMPNISTILVTTRDRASRITKDFQLDVDYMSRDQHPETREYHNPSTDRSYLSIETPESIIAQKLYLQLFKEASHRIRDYDDILAYFSDLPEVNRMKVARMLIKNMESDHLITQTPESAVITAAARLEAHIPAIAARLCVFNQNQNLFDHSTLQGMSPQMRHLFSPNIDRQKIVEQISQIVLNTATMIEGGI